MTCDTAGSLSGRAISRITDHKSRVKPSRSGSRVHESEIARWRQRDSRTAGRFVEYQADQVSPDMSFLEMLDVVNEGLIKRSEDLSLSIMTVEKASAVLAVW